MATRTISATGGNFNATTTWIEGVVPVAADDIIANSTSANLTVNVASTVRSFQFDGGGIANFWTGQLSIPQNFTVNGSGTVGTVSFSPFMSMTGSGTFNLNSTGRYTTYGFTLSTSVNFAGNPKTLVDDINWRIPNGVAGRSWNHAQLSLNRTPTGTASLYLWCSENQAQFPAFIGPNNLQTNSGSASIYIKSNNGTVWGNAGGTTGLNINSEGSYFNGVVGSGIFVDCAPGTVSVNIFTVARAAHLEWISGGVTGSQVIQSYTNWPGNITSADSRSWISWPYRWNHVWLRTGVSATNMIQQFMGTTLSTSVLALGAQESQSNFTKTIQFNLPIDASNVYIINNPRPTTNTGTFPFGLSNDTTSVQFAPNHSYTFGRINTTSGNINRVIIKSMTASAPATLTITSPGTFSSFTNTDFTDIDISGATFYAISDCSVLRSTGVTTSLPTGGGGGGGPSSTTFLM
jgi:hypothetical protein